MQKSLALLPVFSRRRGMVHLIAEEIPSWIMDGRNTVR